MEVSVLNKTLERHKLWIETNGVQGQRANLYAANLYAADLYAANLKGAILPEISWIIPGCLVRLNHVKYDFFLRKENKFENFVQGSFGFFIQDNPAEDTFDMLLGDRIIRNIPYWVKYTGLKQIPKNNEG